MLFLCPEPSDGFITKSEINTKGNTKFWGDQQGFITKSEINTKGNTKFWGDQQGLSDLGPTPSGTTSLSCLAHTPADSHRSPADTQLPARALPGTCLLPQITSGSRPRFFRFQHKGCGFWNMPSQPSLFTLLFFFMRLPTTQYRISLFTGLGGLQVQGFCSAAAAAAKSLQSCPILYDPIDGSPLGSTVPGILQARTPEWVAISFSNAWKWKVKVKSLSLVRLLATPWTAAYQAPPSMGFSRQE